MKQELSRALRIVVVHTTRIVESYMHTIKPQLIVMDSRVAPSKVNPASSNGLYLSARELQPRFKSFQDLIVEEGLTINVDILGWRHSSAMLGHKTLQYLNGFIQLKILATFRVGENHDVRLYASTLN